MSETTIQTQCPECHRTIFVKAHDPRTVRPELQCAACIYCNRVYRVQTHLATETAAVPARAPAGMLAVRVGSDPWTMIPLADKE